jgi:signal transduction histidine kinase/ligand-binding sensor domain-containing protein
MARATLHYPLVLVDGPKGAARRRSLPVGKLGRLGCLCLLLGTLLLPLKAQSLAMRQFNNRDGVPQSQVTALLEDRHGFIWASTNDGLVRLGPNGSQLFDARNGLLARDATRLLEDRDGAIWVPSTERGLARIRGREVSNFGRSEGLLDENIHCLLETRQGDLLVGSHRGLFRKRGERFEAVVLPEPWFTSVINSMVEDAEGWVWLASRKGALARWNGSRLEPAVLPGVAARANDILSIQKDPSGQLWALQEDCLLRRGQDGVWSRAALPGLPATVVLSSFSFDSSGELLLPLGSDGLYLGSPDGSFRILNARDLPCRESIRCALRDRHGGLWLGTDGDYLWAQPFPGLLSLARHPVTQAELGLGTVLSILELPGHRMLLGSNTGVFLWEAGRGLVQHWNRGNGLVSEDVWVMHPDNQGGAWVGTTQGLFRLGSGGRLLPGPRELAKAHVQCIAARDKRLWVGTDKGLAELDEQGRFLALHVPMEETGYSAVHCLLPRTEDLLVGSGKGLLRFKDGTFQLAFPGNPVDKWQILALHQDASGRLWVGTSQSLQVREPGKGTWSTLGLEAGGQELNSISWIRSLATGTIAIGHAKGVTLVSPQGKATHLTRRLGLLSDETNQGAALEDSQGRLWIGMVGGVCILDQLKTFPVLTPPTPVVLDVAWERGSFWNPRVVTLPPGFDSLAVHLDAGMPCTPFPVRFEASSGAQDAPWRPLEPGPGNVYYGGLNPGTHRLRFRASLDGMSWRESTPLQLTIQPRWFMTLWARGSLVLLVILGAFVLVKRRFQNLNQKYLDLDVKVQERTRELEGKTQELAQRNQSLEWTHRQLKETLASRMQLISTVSHDLRSPLTSILLSVERIQEFSDEVQPKVAKTLGIMAQEARRLEAIVKGLLDRNRAESLADRLVLEPVHPKVILENLEETLILKAESRGLRTHLYIEPASLEVQVLLDVAAMQQVLFNLVENALKFTDQPGDVGVRSSLQDQHWLLEVWDTGRGIPRAECDRLFNPFEQGRAPDAEKGWGLGLFICRSIVEAHGGRIVVDSDSGKGSIFQVFIPLFQVQPPQ